MRSAFLHRIIRSATLAMAFVAVASIGVSAQGKGHGGGHGNGGGGAKQERAGAPGGQNRGQEMKAQRIQQREARQQPQRVERQAPVRQERVRPQPQVMIDPRVRDDRGNARWQRQERAVQRDYELNRQSRPQPSWNGDWKNYGQFRKAEVHARNDARKAEHDFWKNFWKPVRDQDREARRFWDRVNRQSRVAYVYDPYPYYGTTYVYQPYREPTRNTLLRSIIGMVLGVNNDGYYSSQPAYSYYPTYTTTYYNDGYYYTYPQYRSLAYAPVYEPTSYYYSSNYAQPYYGYGNNIDLAPGLTGRGFVGRLVSQILATAYEQGYRDASYVPTTRVSRNYCPDPYAGQIAYTDANVVYSNYGYDPYSSLDRNRQSFSEGYELGFRDGLNAGRNEAATYSNYYGGGDLVSALLGNVVRVSV